MSNVHAVQPLTTDQIQRAALADVLTGHPSPPLCRWLAARAGSTSDLTFTFTKTDSLQQLWDQARQNGYDTEHLTVTRQALGTTTTRATSRRLEAVVVAGSRGRGL